MKYFVLFLILFIISCIPYESFTQKKETPYVVNDQKHTSDYKHTGGDHQLTNTYINNYYHDNYKSPLFSTYVENVQQQDGSFVHHVYYTKNKKITRREDATKLFTLEYKFLPDLANTRKNISFKNDYILTFDETKTIKLHAKDNTLLYYVRPFCTEAGSGFNTFIKDTLFLIYFEDIKCIKNDKTLKMDSPLRDIHNMPEKPSLKSYTEDSHEVLMMNLLLYTLAYTLFVPPCV